MSYLETTHNVYKEAALSPDVGLCCTTNPIWELPGLKIPRIMQEMNYGCGSTVHARDLTNNPKMLYVGVGGGMELLQFAYLFSFLIILLIPSEILFLTLTGTISASFGAQFQI